LTESSNANVIALGFLSSLEFVPAVGLALSGGLSGAGEYWKVNRFLSIGVWPYHMTTFSLEYLAD
jgi:hypothetical protein